MEFLGGLLVYLHNLDLEKNLVLEAELMILEEYSYMHLDRYRSAIPN